MGSNFGNHKWAILSVLFLALLTPFMVQFITKNSTSTINYAAEGSKPSIELGSVEGPLTLGSYVTFSTTVPRDVRNPRIEVLCYQDNLFTFGTAGGIKDKFQLGGTDSRWLNQYPNDPAECVANLYYLQEENGKQVHHPIASTNFSVEGKEQ